MDFWGVLYVGDEDKTKTGIECQSWVTRMPMHKVNDKLTWYLKGMKLRAKNHCRNNFLWNVPRESFPWCYTMDPGTKRQVCGVPYCEEVRRQCATGMCQEYQGHHRRNMVTGVIPYSSTRCTCADQSGWRDKINPYSKFANGARMCTFPRCGNLALGDDQQPYGRLTGPWCPAVGFGREKDPMLENFNWAPCDLPLIDDRELTYPVHYTHREVPTRMFVFWRLKMATVRFWLRAWSDYQKGAAVLYVTEFPGPGVAAVEVIIGYENRESKVCLRDKGFQRDRCVKKDTPNIISAEEWREFWVRLDAGMVEFGYAGEGRPLIKTSASEVGNFAYLSTANDLLDPKKQEFYDERRHINMWAFQKDLLAFRPDESTSIENEYCQEFNTVGAAWYSHIFKMKPLTTEERELYAGDYVWEDNPKSWNGNGDSYDPKWLKKYRWRDYKDQLFLGADVWVRAPPKGYAFILSNWPGVMDRYLVNVKIVFDKGDVHVNVHNCNPTKPYDCSEIRRSRDRFWRALPSVRMYNGDRRPRVVLSLAKWTRVRIVSQSHIFRIITYDDISGKVSGKYSYDLMHLGLMSNREMKDIIQNKYGFRNRESNIYRAYGRDDGKLQAFQFRYIGFGADGSLDAPPVVGFIRLNCRSSDLRPLTTYPNCILDKDEISTRNFQGSWTVTKTGELCTAWASVRPDWHMLEGNNPPQSDWSKEGSRGYIANMLDLLKKFAKGEVAVTSRDTSNNCRNFPGLKKAFCFVKRYGVARRLDLRKGSPRSATKQADFFDMAAVCDLPLCQYTKCRASFLGQTYRGNNRSSGFVPHEECRELSRLKEDPEFDEWDQYTYGEHNLCRNDEHREKLEVDRPFCFVQFKSLKPMKRFCNSAPLCTGNPLQHLVSNNEVRLRLHSRMAHYTHVGVRAMTPTIRRLGVLACFSDMIWDKNSKTACVYIGNNFFLGLVITYNRNIKSGITAWPDALGDSTVTETTSLNLAREMISPQIEGLKMNWYWFKFCSEFIYIGREDAFSPLMAVPYTDAVVLKARRLRDNKKSFESWLDYIGKIQVGDRVPLTEEQPKIDVEKNKNSRSRYGSRVFSHLLLQGNQQHGVIYGFNPKNMRNMCPLFSIEPKLYPPVSFSLNRRQTLDNGAVETVVEFSIKFVKKQTSKRAGFRVRFAEMANGKETGFGVYDVMFTHRRESQMKGYFPGRWDDWDVGDSGDTYALMVVQHRPSRTRKYREQLRKAKQEFKKAENPFWSAVGKAVFIEDTADGGWHHFVIRIVTNLQRGWPKQEADIHIEVPGENSYRCIFQEKVNAFQVADIQYFSFLLLDGNDDAALVMLDLMGDDCQPPSDDDLKPVALDGGWGMWSSWDCSASCDGGFGSRQRLCNNPVPTMWGKDCDDWTQPREFGLCNNHKCGSFSDETRLRMLYSLANNPVSLDLREEEQFVLRCKTDAYQAALEQYSMVDTIWLRNGNKWRTDNNRMELQGVDVLVRNASRVDTGVYSCLVQPEEGAAGLAALVAVVVRTGDVTRRAMTGDKIEFDCQGELFDQVYDDLLHFWSLDGELYSYMGTRVFPDEDHTNLTLPKMDPNDPMEPRFIAVEEIRLEELNETLINTMSLRVASDALSGQWECAIYQPKYKLLWITNWFNLEVEPYDPYKRLTMGPVAQALVGGVKGPIIYGTVGTIGGLALLAGTMYWFVRRRQRRIEAQMVLFKQAGLWNASGETAALLADDEGAEEGDDGRGGGLVSAGEDTEDTADTEDTVDTDDLMTFDNEDSSNIPPPPPPL